MAHEYIGLQNMLDRLGGAKEKRGDEYLCLCPCHEDHHPSLWVKETEKGIMMTCRAGCRNDEICAKVGIKMGQLFRDPPSGNTRQWKSKQQNPAPSPARSKSKNLTPFSNVQEAYHDLGQVVKVYPYTDTAGKLRFEVVRILKKDGDKTFRQHRPLHPPARFPFVKEVPHDVRRGILYRMPELAAAKEADSTVYVVEGEKDADTLAQMGLMGTTCPGGSGKWDADHSEQLRDVDVVVLPDHDAPGYKHGRQVVDSLLGVARSVREIHLIDGYPNLPEKGDITDLAELVGMDEAKRILEELCEKSLDMGEDLYNKARAAFARVPGYCIENGCICQRNDDSVKVLGTFVALPVREVTRDDGLQVIRQLEIAGWNSAGKRMPQAWVDMEKFGGMGWAATNWGLAANIMPGTTVKDKLRMVITAAGAQTATQHTIYSHTGWRKINGKWAYLYNGGCIGAENVEVQMEGKLSNYSLGDVPEGLDPLDAMIVSHGLLWQAKRAISVPLLGYMYLAPLREFLLAGGQPPSFAMMLKGGTSTHKSTVAALFLSHFGVFTYDGLTASFHDTANAIRRQAFTLKDVPLVVDDYHPTASMQERRKMMAIAQELSRTFGDGASRNRMGSDLTLQASMPARCLALLTGEELPDIGESGTNRYYVIEVHEGDVAYTKAFGDYQRRARIGELRAAMRGYIEWLLPQADSLSAELREMFLAYRDKAWELLKADGKKVHDRAAPAVAHILVGLTMMLKYMVSLGLLEAEDIDGLLEEYWQDVLENSRRQAEKSAEERPLKMYMTAVSEMVASHSVTVIDISKGYADINRADKNVVGYMDGQNYYFLAGTLWGAVNQFYAEQGRVLATNQAEIHRMLVEEGIVTQIGSDGKTTKNKRINGKAMRLLWIPRWQIDGGKKEEQPEQMAMQEVDDPDNPFKSEEDNK